MAIIVLALLLVSGAQAGDPQAGKLKAEPCLACHGATGNSELEAIPSLAGQPEYYLTAQLILMRDEQRQVEAMKPFLQGLSDQDVENLAAFFSSLPPNPPPADDKPAASSEGKRLADANHCGQCHLPSFAGREQMARLAGQREDYLLKAMQDFKANRRAGLDGTMTEVLYNLTEADLATLAHYLAHLR